jgi:plasmid stabilization system protein ParE
VSKPTLKIVWNNHAINFLRRAIERIKEDSPQNAVMVKEGIAKAVDSLINHPERHPMDMFKSNNDGSYRAFEKFSFRIAYRITETQILILRVRHVKQEPKNY